MCGGAADSNGPDLSPLLFFSQVMFHFRKVEILSSATFKDVQYIFTGCFKVGCGVVRRRNEDLRCFSTFHRLIIIRDSHKPVEHQSRTLES